MARVTLPTGIVAIHGRLGNLIYRSRKQADGSYKVFVHEVPKNARKGIVGSGSKGIISRKRTDIGPTLDRKRTDEEVANEQK